MQCTNPIFIDGAGYVPCSRCKACRLKRSSQWTMRLQHEYEYWNHKGMFITLTYEDKYLPENGYLVKEDFQKFIKRLRKDLKKEYRNFKYFACGEYGNAPQLIKRGAYEITTSGYRPHYHSIIFGMDYLNEEDHYKIFQNWKYSDWNNGTIRDNSIGYVSADSIRYVTDYIFKKQIGNNEDLKTQYYNKKIAECRDDQSLRHYQLRRDDKIFQVCSNGIGKQYALDNPEMFENGKVIYRGKDMTIPRYYEYINNKEVEKIEDDNERKEKMILLQSPKIKNKIEAQRFRREKHNIISIEDLSNISYKNNKRRYSHKYKEEYERDKQREKNLIAKNNIYQREKI